MSAMVVPGRAASQDGAFPGGRQEVPLTRLAAASDRDAWGDSGQDHLKG